MDDKGIALVAVQQNLLSVALLSDRLKDDKEIMIAAVRYCGFALQFASDRLKGDREIILAAAQEDSRACSAAPTLRDIKNN